MSAIPTTPTEWLLLFRQQIDEIFTYLSDLKGREYAGEQEYTPLIDIYETPESFVVEIDIPGFDRANISLSICCNTLVLEGTKHKDEPTPGGSYICLERRFGRFFRTVEVPPAVDLTGVKARYDRGVLTVTFPWLADRSTIIREIPID